MPVNDEEVGKIISSFKDSSAGWDELKPGIINNIKGCIAMPLAHVCNLSFKKFFSHAVKICKCGSYIQNRKWKYVLKLSPCFSATSFLKITGKTDVYQTNEFYNKQ